MTGIRSWHMSSPWRAALPLFLLAGLAVSLTACGGGEPEGEPEAPVVAGEEPPVAASVGEIPPEAPESEAPEDEATEEPSFLSEQNRRDVSLFFQDADSDQLVRERRKIFQTNSLTDQAKQIVVELIEGPRDQDLLPTIPQQTRVLGLYMDRHGTAYVDLSHELVSLHLGGSAEELATIFSLVNSLTFNLPDIKRVHILVDGEERDTLKSHLDLRRDFVQDLSIVRGHGG
jgi:spore germination protein GerM